MKNHLRHPGTVAVFLLTMLATQAHAEVCIWKQPAFGAFDSASSWEDNRKPGTNDTAVLGSTRTTVNGSIRSLFLMPQGVKGAWVAAGSYEFAFANPEAEFAAEALAIGGSDSEFVGDWISVPPDLPASASLTMHIPAYNYPGVVHTRTLEIGPPPFPDDTIRTGALRVEGLGSRWVNSGDGSDGRDGRLFIGSSGNAGSLTVVGGAKLENQLDILVGGGASRPWGKSNPEMGVGTVVVEGEGSELLASSIGVATGIAPATANYPGNSSRGTLTVQSNGVIRTGSLWLGHADKDLWTQSDDGASAVASTGGRLRVESAVILNDAQTSLTVTTNVGVGLDPLAGSAVVGFWPEPIAEIPGKIQIIGGGTVEGGGNLGGDVVINEGQLHAISYRWVSVGDDWQRVATPRHLKISGTLSEAKWSWIHLRVAGYETNEQSVIHTLGGIDLGGYVEVIFPTGFVPVVGDAFPLFRPGGDFTCTNATLRLICETPGATITGHLTSNGTLLISQVMKPSRLEISLVHGQAEISWDAGGQLQSSPTPTGPWQTITNAPNPYVTPATGNCFFRAAN